MKLVTQNNARMKYNVTLTKPIPSLPATDDTNRFDFHCRLSLSLSDSPEYETENLISGQWGEKGKCHVKMQLMNVRKCDIIEEIYILLIFYNTTSS